MDLPQSNSQTPVYFIVVIQHSSRYRCFLLDLDVTISNVDVGYIHRLMQISSGYFIDVSINFPHYVYHINIVYAGMHRIKRKMCNLFSKLKEFLACMRFIFDHTQPASYALHNRLG